MSVTPPPRLEAAVARLLPPAVRDEVLGDLYEQYQSPAQYLASALQVVPMVVLSRIRRTADARLSLTLALLIYLAYLSTAWLSNQAELLGPFRLASPALLTLMGILIADAYSRPGGNFASCRAPVAGTVLAALAEGALMFARPDHALPAWTIGTAACTALALVSITRLLWMPNAAPPPLQAAHSGASSSSRRRRIAPAMRRPDLLIRIAPLVIVAIIWASQLLKWWWIGR